MIFAFRGQWWASCVKEIRPIGSCAALKNPNPHRSIALSFCSERRGSECSSSLSNLIFVWGPLPGLLLGFHSAHLLSPKVLWPQRGRLPDETAPSPTYLQINTLCGRDKRKSNNTKERIALCIVDNSFMFHVHPSKHAREIRESISARFFQVSFETDEGGVN